MQEPKYQERGLFGCNFTSYRNVWIYSLDTPSVRKGENRMSIELQDEEISVRKGLAIGYMRIIGVFSLKSR